MPNGQSKLCHVGNFHDLEKKAIREAVCWSLPAEYEISNNHYCLLHAPTADKDAKQFESLIDDRVRGGHSHFEAIVIPIPLEFNHSKFDLPLNFKHATFLAGMAFYKVQVKYVYF